MIKSHIIYRQSTCEQKNHDQFKVQVFESDVIRCTWKSVVTDGNWIN